MLVPAATKKQDLLKQWLDTTDFEYPTLERPSKRRRVNYTSEQEATSQPPLPLTPPKVHSDKYRQASKSATCAAWNQIHDEEAINVAAVVNKFVFEQGSSEIDDTTAIENRDKIIQLGEDAEAELSHGFMTTDILPSRAAGKTLKRVQQMPFTNAILPRAIIPDGLSVAIQTICEPKPDVAYGYALQGFTHSQQITQRSTVNGANLSKFSRLAKDLYWPFLLVEFKAPAVGGNMYAAENQCAGGGSASLLACQTLLSMASQANDSTDLTDSVAYSAAIDGAAANLLVHWYDAGDETYCLERIHHYDLNRPEDIQKFQLHTKNIVDWGAGSRLKKIRAALDVILTEEIKKKQLKIKRRAEPLSPPIS
ncbi:MAG: hypothetical protein LQ351_001015 [Letrouitia transgressa]|nr:MAG: hypothetical protein LQ351_001015 [Letrouitia transgressa]